MPKKNLIYERCTFNQHWQLAGENIETYVRTLHEMAVRSEFANIDEAIRDRLVLGIRDKDLSQQLQLMSDLTLQKAVDLAQQRETVQVQLSIQHGELKDNIDAVSYDSHCGGHRAGHHSHHCGGSGGHYGGGAGGHRFGGAGEQRSSGGAKGHQGTGGKSHHKCPNCGRDYERGAMFQLRSA